MTGQPAGVSAALESRERPCRKVLVVEDEAVISLDLTRTLTRLGYTVPGVARTAQEAVEMGLRCKPDLVLMDIWLSGSGDGIEAAAELRRHVDVPIVFATAHADPETVRRAAETDSVGFVTKPFSSADLRLQLEVTFARHARATRDAKQRGSRWRAGAPAVSLQLSSVAHDFNNLLTLILANAEELRRRGDSDEVEQIRRASQLATMLCRQLLPAPGSRPSASGIELNSVLQSNRNLIERAAGEQTRVSFCPNSDGLWVDADEGQISRICINLALNAQRAMPCGGELRISTRKMARSLAQLCISDTGAGIDPAVLPRVFDPFFSGDNDGGSGLGLTIVQGIVSQLGGTISVESECGSGTSFTILLPLVTRRNAPAGRVRGTVEKRPSPSVHRSVLLVEDHPEIRALIHNHLQLAGIDCIETSDAEDAMAKLRARGGPVDLLITDLVLPGASGAELAGECLQRGLCSRVLFISGYAGPPRGHCSPLLHERSESMLKPFTAGEMTARVTAILQSIA